MLGDDQKNVLMLLAAHFHGLPFTKTVNNPHGQFRLFLSGAAGTGKSKLIECIKFYTFMLYGYDYTPHGPVLIAASTGIAAIGINGSTADTLFRLRQYDGGPISDEFRRTLQNELGRAKLLILDEISMTGCTKIGKIDKLMRIATIKYDQFMGGVHYIICGDHLQLPPVKDSCIYKNPINSDNCNELKVSGYELYANTFLYYKLKQVFRQKDNKFTKSLSRARVCQATEEDAKMWNTRLFPSVECAEILNLPNDTMFVASTHATCDEGNRMEVNIRK